MAKQSGTPDTSRSSAKASAGGWRWKIAQAVEIRWWKSYLRGKDPATYLADKSRYWERFLDTIGVRVDRNARVLDAGCGPAGIFLILEQARVDAVDPLLDRYARDLAHFEPEKYPWVRFRQLPLEELGEPAAYDTVFCLNVINHVADLKGSLRSLFEAGKPGSEFVLSIDCHNHGLLRSLFSLVPGDILHPHQYTLDEYLAMVREAGWEVMGTHRIKSARIFDYHAVVCRVPTTV